MIYAALVKKKDYVIQVWGDGGGPAHSILAFGAKSDYDRFLSWLWSPSHTGADCQSGDNLIRVSRKRIDRWFGKDFEVIDYVNYDCNEGGGNDACEVYVVISNGEAEMRYYAEQERQYAEQEHHRC